MTDSATPATTPKKITRTRPTNYPAQVTLMLDAKTAGELEREAIQTGESKSSVARAWLEAGRQHFLGR